MTEQTVEQVSPAAAEAPAPVTTEVSNKSEGQKEAMQFALIELAKKEDATDFANEMRDQAGYKDGDPAFNDPHRKQARADRYQSLLEQAKKDTDSVLGRSFAAAESEAQSEARINIERTKAKAEVRFEQYERENPGFIASVNETVEAYGDLTLEVCDALRESPLAPAILDRICQHPDAIAELNQLPPRELDKFVARMEGLIDGSGSAQKPSPPTPKRISSAPKPVPTVAGKATQSTSKDLNALAKSEDATAFIEEARRRERAKQR